jgi:hypothetical protein
VEVFIDGVLLTTIENPTGSDDLASFTAGWMPEKPGSYVIQTVAYGRSGGTSQPDTSAITFGGMAPVSPLEITPLLITTPEITISPSVTPEISVTPTVTDTPTATPTRTFTPIPEPVIEFWADPDEIDAGD